MDILNPIQWEPAIELWMKKAKETEEQIKAENEKINDEEKKVYLVFMGKRK